MPESTVKVSENSFSLDLSAFCNFYSRKGTFHKLELHNLQPKQGLILCYYWAITQYYIPVAITILNLILNVPAHTNSMFCTICQRWYAPELEKTLLHEVWFPLRCRCRCCWGGGWLAPSEVRDWDNSRGSGWIKRFCWWLIVVRATGYCDAEMINRERRSRQLCQFWVLAGTHPTI